MRLRSGFAVLCVAVIGCRPDLTNVGCERDDNCPTDMRCLARRCVAQGGTSGGSGGGSAGGSTAGGSTAGGSTAGGSTAGGSTAGGSTAGGSTAGGSTAGGSTAGGSTAGGSTAGGATAGGATAGGSSAGGTAGGGSAGGVACSPANCAGCCLANGACQQVPDNRLNAACGSNGVTCTDCTLSGATCGFNGSVYVCQGSAGGGVGGAGGPGGSGAGGASGGGSAGGSTTCGLRAPAAPPPECLSGRQFTNTTPLPVSSVAWAATGDVNRDCNPDLLLQEGPAPSTLYLLLGRGDGGFSAPIGVGTGTFEPTLSDVNGDGLLDISTSYLPSQQIGVMYNLDGGAFGPVVGIASGLATQNALGFAAGDVNGDGLQDDFATGTEDWFSTVDAVILRRTTLGDGGSGYLRDFFDLGPAKMWSAAIGDLDHDGGADVVFGRFTSSAGGVTVVRSSGGGLSPAQSYVVAGYPIVVRIGDVTGDGWNDIVGGLWATGQVAVWANRQDGTFASTPALTSLAFTACNPSSGCLWGLTVADLNRDGIADAVVPGINDNRLSVIMGSDGGFPATATEFYTVGDAGARPTRTAAGDFNRDGRQDVVVTTETGPAMLFLHCP